MLRGFLTGKIKRDAAPPPDSRIAWATENRVGGITAAIRAAQIMGLRVAGVDMLEGKDGPKLMEINSSPGLEGIEGATGIDVAGAIIGLVTGNARRGAEIKLARDGLWARFPVGAFGDDHSGLTDAGSILEKNR